MVLSAFSSDSCLLACLAPLPAARLLGWNFTSLPSRGLWFLEKTHPGCLLACGWWPLLVAVAIFGRRRCD